MQAYQDSFVYANQVPTQKSCHRDCAWLLHILCKAAEQMVQSLRTDGSRASHQSKGGICDT